MSSIIDDLEKSGNKFIVHNRGVLYSRYDSWDFCYKKFIDISKKENLSEEDLDSLALNLAFYLASWGMYRGSSFLLQNNYKIHQEAAKKIIEFIKENKTEIYNDKKLEWNKVEKIKNELISYYKKVEFYKKRKKQKGNVTDTLVTKILLGTTGIVPAYDRNVKYCLKILGIPQSFGEKSYNQVNQFYDDENNNKVFKKIRKLANEKSKLGINYPRMKILDMCMWQYYIDNKNEDDN